MVIDNTKVRREEPGDQIVPERRWDKDRGGVFRWVIQHHAGAGPIPDGELGQSSPAGSPREGKEMTQGQPQAAGRVRRPYVKPPFQFETVFSTRLLRMPITSDRTIAGEACNP